MRSHELLDVVLGKTLPAWDHEHQKVELPAGLCLIMGDVSGGSNTPSMVRKLLEWNSRSDRCTERAAAVICWGVGVLD